MEHDFTSDWINSEIECDLAAKLRHKRIEACNTLIDHILDDIPHSRQQPLLDGLRSLRGDLMIDDPPA